MTAFYGFFPSCNIRVCRVWDTSIIVAIEEMPDEGLEQPLRLDKLANEVRSLAQTLSTALHGPCTCDLGDCFA